MASNKDACTCTCSTQSRPHIASVTSVNSGGYNLTDFLAVGNVGKTFALMLGSGKYAVVRISSYTDLGGGDGRVVMEYKYQADGTTSF